MRNAALLFSLVVFWSGACAQSIPKLADPRMNQILMGLADEIDGLYSQRGKVFALPQGSQTPPCPMSPQEITDAFITRHPSAPPSQNEIEGEQFTEKTMRRLGVKSSKVVREAYTPYFVTASCVDGKLEGPFIGMLSYKLGAEGTPQRTQMIEKVEASMRQGKPTGVVRYMSLSVYGAIPDAVSVTVADSEDFRNSVGLTRTERNGRSSMHTVASKALGGDRRKTVSIYLDGVLFSEQEFKGGFPHGKTIRPKGGFFSSKDTVECYIEGEKILDPECKVD